VAAADGRIYWVHAGIHDKTWSVDQLENNVLSVSGFVTPVWLQVTEMFNDDEYRLESWCNVFKWTNEALAPSGSCETSEALFSASGIQRPDTLSTAHYLLPLTWPTHDVPEGKEKVASFGADYQF